MRLHALIEIVKESTDNKLNKDRAVTLKITMFSITMYGTSDIYKLHKFYPGIYKFFAVKLG